MARKRSNVNALARLLGTAVTPVYAVDSQRRIVYCNAALTQWLGVEPKQLMGVICNYHSGVQEGSDRFDPNLLCPPPEAFLQTHEAELTGLRTDGRTVCRRARFVPLGGAAGVVVVVDECELAESAGKDPHAEDTGRLHNQLRRLLSEIGAEYRLAQVVGSHPALVRARELIRLAATSDFRALVVGPPGSGREHIARTIHYGGRRQTAAPLAPLACSLLDAELLEQTVTSFIASCAELQVEQPPALLLLEIDQLAPDAQRALAGLLSVGEWHLRTVATARRRLIELAAEGGFREDLAFSLSTLEIAIPPLSSRREDIPLLTQFFLEKQNAAGGKQLSGLDREASERLLTYSWPGNADELAEVVAESCSRASGPRVLASDLPPRLEWAARAAARPATRETMELDAFLGEVEKELLQRALRQARGKKARAARLLGITPARLLRRLEHFDLSPDRSPPPLPPDDAGDTG